MKQLLDGGREVVERWPGETAVAVATVTGWGFLSWAAADLFGAVAWKLGAGTLLLGLVGYGMLATILREGLYTLTLIDEEDE